MVLCYHSLLLIRQLHTLLVKVMVCTIGVSLCSLTICMKVHHQLACWYLTISQTTGSNLSSNTTILHYISLPLMTRTPFAAYATSSGITSVNPTVRVNTNDYPFITVLRGSGDDSAENLYFSIKASGHVAKGQKITSEGLYVVETINAKGESRTKLSFEGDSNYIDASEF